MQHTVTSGPLHLLFSQPGTLCPLHCLLTKHTQKFAQLSFLPIFLQDIYHHWTLCPFYCFLSPPQVCRLHENGHSLLFHHPLLHLSVWNRPGTQWGLHECALGERGVSMSWGHTAGYKRALCQIENEGVRGHSAAGLGLLFCMYLTIIIKRQHQAQGKQLL